MVPEEYKEYLPEEEDDGDIYDIPPGEYQREGVSWSINWFIYYRGGGLGLDCCCSSMTSDGISYISSSSSINPSS